MTQTKPTKAGEQPRVGKYGKAIVVRSLDATFKKFAVVRPFCGTVWFNTEAEAEQVCEKHNSVEIPNETLSAPTQKSATGQKESTPRHTPGPWSVRQRTGKWTQVYILDAANKGAIAEISPFGNVENCLVHGANARLIAAAPDYKWAFELLVDVHYGTGFHHIGDGDGIPKEDADKIRKLLAEGRQ